MTAFDALASAIRERLVSGHPAPLPGLGTLVRQHVSARIEERPDGTRVLLPPGETIGLAPTDASHPSLAAAFGRLQALPEAEADDAYATAMDQLEARLAATGEVRLPGVGLLRRTSGGVVLGVEAELLAAVNRAFEGLGPVGTDPMPEPETTEMEVEEMEVLDDDAFSYVETAPEAAAPEEVDPEPEPTSEPEPDPEPEPELEPEFEDAGPDAWAPMEADTEDTASVPEPEHEPEPDAASTESAFDDGEPVPEDEAAGFAVPFGAPDDTPPADFIPPTPPETDPAAEPPAQEAAPPLEDDDDWASETWTASAAAPSANLLGAERPDLIEDADFEVLPPEEASPPIERVSPDAELEALFSTPQPTAMTSGAVPPAVAALAPEVDAEPVPEPAPEAAASGRTFGWVIGLVLLALLAAAAVWFWTTSRTDTPPSVPEPIPQAAPTGTASALGAVPADTVAAARAESAPASATVMDGEAGPAGASAAPAASAPSAAAPRQTTSETAVSPPRLDGLDDGDRRALVGGPIDPAMGGWTIVVASLRSEEAADTERDLYAEAGYRTGVFPPSERGQTRYRVGVGQFGSEDHARRLRDRLPPRAPADAWLLNLRSL